MFSLYKTGLAVFNFIVRTVQLTLRLGHSNVKTLIDER
jgi:hypothetical protein